MWRFKLSQSLWVAALQRRISRPASKQIQFKTETGTNRDHSRRKHCRLEASRCTQIRAHLQNLLSKPFAHQSNNAAEYSANHFCHLFISMPYFFILLNENQTFKSAVYFMAVQRQSHSWTWYLEWKKWMVNEELRAWEAEQLNPCSEVHFRVLE